ncbi:MAG: helix-turn-helix transcriptional regulator [Clostridium cochlearium]|nr:helix-turn-helix transcriptional regulator [Clostridium cochlearium]MDU1443053.1 helix-turn-helix transcriptional regulator [Clostridium cochlearium]
MGTTETGKLISTIRKQKGMTQKDIATLLNVSDKAVSKWERGECYPEVTLLPQLSSILEISID